MKHFVSFMTNSLSAFFLCLSFFVISNSLNGNSLDRPQIQGVSSDNSYYYYSLIPPISQNSPTPDSCKCKFYQDAVHTEIQHYYRLCQGASVIGDPYEKSGIFNQYETMELCNSGIDYEKKNESFKVLKVSDSFKKPLPTNQWYSSLAWKMGLLSNITRKSEDYFSSPMFALPLSYKTVTDGLNLGYNDIATVDKSSTYGYPRSYTFPQNGELLIGVGNGDINETSIIKAFDSVLDNHSDWAVTALWRDESKNRIMSSTFAHGLPFTYFETSHDNAIIKVIPSNKLTYFTYTLENIDGDYINNGKTEFYIPIKVPNKDFVAVSTKVKVTYDFNSQGQDIREEDYTQFNSAPSTDWEFYTTEEDAIQKITILNNPSQSFQKLSKGKITLEIWVSNHGTNPNGYSVIDNSKAYLKVPFNVNPDNDNKLYLKSQSDNAYNSQLVENLNSSQKNDSLKTQSFQVINTVNNGVLFTTGNHNYAAFGPVGTTWEVDDENWVLKSNLTGNGYFSIALLPDESSDSTKRDSLFQTFSQYASSFLKSDSGTQVSWQYDKGMQVLKTTYEFQFDQKDSKAGVNSTLVALYPHHWDSLPKGQFEELGTYKSPRGTLHLIDLSASNNKFVTELPFSGIIPALPMSDFWTQEEVQNIYNDILWACQISQSQQSNDCNIYAQISPNQNTYGEGKSFLMYAELVNLTDELNKYYRRTGDTEKASNTLRYRNSILERLEARLEDWFTFKSINDPYFYYDKQFSTFIGYPSGFGSSNEINDHMFHYGYFVHAAAIVARYDEDWKNKWAPNINMLIHDFANHQRSNSGDFKDTPTPFLRNFDVFEGHAWASGHANSDLGNNEESSSESMNAFAGIALWGSEIGDETIRDLGIYLFTTGVQSLNYYHFDMQNKVFPSEYTHTMCSRIFGSGCDYETFFGVTPLYGHGMNFMPFTSTSVYLGSNSTYTEANFNSLKLELGDKDGNIPFDDATAPWGIINAEQLSMSNPKEAFIIVNSIWGKKPTWAYLTDGGDSKAHAEAFIGAMFHLGQLSENRSWQPDTANFLGFNKEGHITEILYNPSRETKTFNFSNGNPVTLKSHEIATNKMSPLDFIPYSQDKTVVKEESVKDEL